MVPPVNRRVNEPTATFPRSLGLNEKRLKESQAAIPTEAATSSSDAEL